MAPDVVVVFKAAGGSCGLPSELLRDEAVSPLRGIGVGRESPTPGC